MTGFVVKAPPGLVIEHAHPADGWTENVAGSSATWTGGPLAHLALADFEVSLKATAAPGPIVLESEQRYDSGAVVRWPVSMTVVPGNEENSQNLLLAAVVGVIGLLVVAAVALLAWRRRTAPAVSPKP
jgi:hypothetical protein